MSKSFSIQEEFPTSPSGLVLKPIDMLSLENNMICNALEFYVFFFFFFHGEHKIC